MLAILLAMALRFEVLARHNRARASRLTLPHYEVQTPLFMPVGTQGTIKGLTNEQLEDLDCQIILGNTYHLALRPGADLLDTMGGLHKFMNWPRGLLTDSGGFQMVSLLHLADITEEGVTFQSPVDGKAMLLTPEESIQIQLLRPLPKPRHALLRELWHSVYGLTLSSSNRLSTNKIGADIIMALDDVVKTTTTGPRVEEAMHRTLRWIDRCIAAHSRLNEQNLFGIVQGGLDPQLRDICLKGLVARNLPGYAIGGLAGGEGKDAFWRVVAQCTAGLPDDKPRYVMGVLRLTHAAMATDNRPLDSSCPCMVCKRYTRAYLHTIVTKEPMGSQLVSYHNVAYMMQLSSNLHNSILEGTFSEFAASQADAQIKCTLLYLLCALLLEPNLFQFTNYPVMRFVQTFLQKQFPKGDVPEWVCDAMDVAGIDISMCCAPQPTKTEEVQI